jgi:hypothetical protein
MLDVPSTKVTAAGLAGAVVTIVAFLLDVFTDVEFTAGTAAAVATVLATLFGFVVKETNPPPSAVEAVAKKVETGELEPITPSYYRRDLLAEEQGVYDQEQDTGQDFDPDGGPGPGSVI